MTSNKVYNTEMGFSGGLVVLAETDLGRYGIFACNSKRLNHFKGTISYDYFLEVMEYQTTDGESFPVTIDYIRFKRKADLLKAFKHYVIK